MVVVYVGCRVEEGLTIGAPRCLLVWGLCWGEHSPGSVARRLVRGEQCGGWVRLMRLHVGSGDQLLIRNVGCLIIVW
jgi:hypothetical protein